MPQNRYRWNITTPEGESVAIIEPPPFIVELVKDNPKAEMIWKNWFDQFYKYIGALTASSNSQFITASSITKNTGGTAVGTVTDTQTLLDGNVYQVPEVASTPGFDIDFNFTNVNTISGFVSMIRYTGATTPYHEVVQTLYNYTNTTDDAFLLIPHAPTAYQYRTVLIPDDTNYINSSGQATISLIHNTAGIGTHNVYIDYIALIGT